MNSRVQVFTADGVYQREIGKLGDSPGQFGRPKGIGVDAQGRVYAMDAAFDNLQIFDNNGRLLLALGENGSLPGQFWLANGIAINRSNEIFVADSYNRRVQVFKYVGENPNSE
jgi:sugar lactone lactonase YvrE